MCYFILYSLFEFKKSRTIKGNSRIVGQLCNQMLIFTKQHPLSQLKQPTKQFHTWPALARAAVPPIKGGTPIKGGSADLFWPLGPRGCLYLWTLPTTVITDLRWNISCSDRPELSLSLLHCCSYIPQANPWFQPSILERKGSKTWLESRSTNSQSLRAFGSRLVGGSRVCYSWRLLLVG